MALTNQSLASLRPTTAAPAIMPLQRSVLGATPGRSVSTPPRELADRPVVARLAPPRAPVSFASEQAAIRANGGRPLSVTQLSRMRPYMPATPVRLDGPMRSDRPQGADGQPTQSGTQRPDAARYAPSQHQGAPQQRFITAPREVPQQRFTPPPRQIPQQRFTPPPRQIPQQQRFTPHYNPPPQQERPSAPRAAPSRAPEARPEVRPPPEDRRADAAPASLGAYAAQWQSPPPMYRPQLNTIRDAAPLAQPQPAGSPYRPPASPPPMYRPIPLGGAAARPPAPPNSGHLAIERPRHIG